MAVIISPGYGSGYSTEINMNGLSTAQREFLKFGDLEFVKMIEAKASADDLYRYALKKLPANIISEDLFESLDIAWLQVGERFRITKYDGAESIEIYKPFDWSTA